MRRIKLKQSCVHVETRKIDPCFTSSGSVTLLSVLFNIFPYHVRVPLIVEIWSKSANYKDVLVGISQFYLSTVFSSGVKVHLYICNLKHTQLVRTPTKRSPAAALKLENETHTIADNCLYNFLVIDSLKLNWLKLDICYEK